MIQLLNKQISILFKFAIYTPPATQPRIIKAKKLPQLQMQTVNLNIILQNFQINPFARTKQQLKDKWQYQQSSYFLNQILKSLKVKNTLPNVILKEFQKNNLFQHFFNILSKKDKLGKTQQSMLSNLITLILSLYTYSNFKIVNQKIIKSSILMLNKYFMLIPLNLRIINQYLKFSIKYRDFLLKIQGDQVKFVNEKFIFDFILQSKQINFNFDFIILTLKYCWHFDIETRYHEKHQEILNFLISRIPKSWVLPLAQQQNSLKNFLSSFININFYNQNMVNGIKYILKEQNFNKFQSTQICLGMRILLQLRQITNQNILQFLPIMKKLMIKQPIVFFPHIIPQLFRASIWVKQIWIYFFQWLILQKNFEKIKIYYLYSIYCLMTIDKDLIPLEIISAQNKARNYILQKHNFRYDTLDCLKQFYSMMKQQFKTNHLTVQQSFTNNLRLISQVQIKSQMQIAMFFVDIVIDNKTVIQVNNRHHYIHNIDNKTYFYNLKSQFRKRVLEKLGYQYIDLDIFQIKQGSFQMIRNLYNIGVLSNESK